MAQVLLALSQVVVIVHMLTVGSIAHTCCRVTILTHTVFALQLKTKRLCTEAVITV